MRVLVVSEGPHEQAGALKNILKKLGGENAAFESDRVANNHIHAIHGKGKGYYKKALRWISEAEKRKCNALVFLIDMDGDKKRVHDIQEAQTSSMFTLPRALGVAIQAFDAWMLADEKALSHILGYAVPKQPDPETIRDPKQACMNLLNESPDAMAQRDMYARVASQIDMTILSERCQTGFKPFAENVKHIFQSM